MTFAVQLLRIMSWRHTSLKTQDFLRLCGQHMIITWFEQQYYACESYHSHLRNTYTAAHPNIFVYVTGRQQIQNDVYIIDFVLLVRTPYCSTKHDIEKRLFVQKYNNLYHAQSITRLEYLRHVSYKFLPVDLQVFMWALDWYKPMCVAVYQFLALCHNIICRFWNVRFLRFWYCFSRLWYLAVLMLSAVVL